LQNNPGILLETAPLVSAQFKGGKTEGGALFKTFQNIRIKRTERKSWMPPTLCRFSGQVEF
jgi:hypothetical protein